MPIEVLAARGHDAIRFGPMKPVGLRDPKTGHRPWAVLQLRTENLENTLYNLVGFSDQFEVWRAEAGLPRMIPGLAHAEFVRYGVMHRNTFLNSPQVLQGDFSCGRGLNCFFAGQITGVEGLYGIRLLRDFSGLNLVRRIRGQEPLILPETSMMGAF